MYLGAHPTVAGYLWTTTTCGREMQVVICTGSIASWSRYVLLHINIRLPTRHALDSRWHSVYGCCRDWRRRIDDLFQMGLEKSRWQEGAGSMMRSRQPEGKPTKKQRRGDPGVEPRRKRTPRRLAFLGQSGRCPLDIFPIESKFRTFWGPTQAPTAPTACHRV